MPSLKCLSLQTAPVPLWDVSGAAIGGTATGGSGVGGAKLRPAAWDVLVGDLVNRVGRYDLLDRPALTLASQ